MWWWGRGGESKQDTNDVEDKEAHKACAAVPDMCSALSQPESIAVEMDAIRHPIGRRFPILHL